MERESSVAAAEPNGEAGPDGLTDRFISPAILARGEPHVTRARVLVFQSAAIAVIAAFSTLYQVRFGASALGLVGTFIAAAALITPFLLRRAHSHVWVSGVLTANLFLALSVANFVTAGHGVVSTIFITAVPLVATLTQGVRLGALWGALTLAELLVLALFREFDVEPLVMPNPRAAEIGTIRASVLVTMLVTSTGMLHAYFNDLASRRAVESESNLERNRANYREMLDSSPDGLFSVSEGGIIDFANHTLIRLLGLSSRLDIQGRSLSEILVGADLEHLRDEAAELGEAVAVECDVVHADGTRIPVEVATSRFYVYGDRGQVFRVRDNRRFQTAHREAQILRATFDEAPMGVGVFRLDDTEVLYANDAYLELTAFTRDELIGNRLIDLGRSEESNELLLSIQRVLARGESINLPKQDWHQFGTKPGYVDIRSFTVQPPGEDAPRWVTFVRDVTAVVELEREVSRAERIDSLGKLAGGIAHDFNNLLTVIMGQVDILDEDLGGDHWAHDYLATIMDACERSAALTSKVLDFSRKQMLRPTVFMVDDAIRSLVPLLRQLVPERISLDLGIAPDDDPRVRCDPSRFEQIVLNLVANARDAIDGTGTIVVRVRTHPGSEDIHRSLGEVEIEVSDDGAGMSKDVQDRIFDPFFTTKPVGEGTGLGLSTVHGIVHQSGGRLEVSSREGQGTTLRVFLPWTDAPLTVPETQANAGAAIEGGLRTVLVVEDNPDVRALVTRTLERLGFSVVAAQDGNEAKAWIEDRDRDFEALISDIVMPGVSGVEVARLFRARFTRQRIILMSGYAEDEIGPIEQLPSDIRFVQKPVTAKVLGDALR
ncbi:MAG: ATP-binding protein [bacterium]|nr:ATP-binding protein [bacterium]